MLHLASDALHDHLHRLLVAGLASVLVGLYLVFVRREDRDFGIMTAAWGAIDAVIALASMGAGRATAASMVPTIAFNEGLDAGYVGVGLAMILLAGERRRIKAFGLAIVVQGAILLALDGKLWSDLARAQPFK